MCFPLFSKNPLRLATLPHPGNEPGLRGRVTRRFIAGIGITAWLLLAIAGTAQVPKSSASPLLNQADAVFREMSRITGLPIRASLKKQIVGRAQMEVLLKAKLHSGMTAEEATLKAFGLVPPDFDLGKFLISFYTEQAAGFYDPQSKTMYIAAWVAPDMQKMVLAHELTHALQDQTFYLDQFLHVVKDNDDESNARQAVVEGYATAAMMQYLIEPVPLTAMPSLRSFMASAIQQSPARYPVFARAPFFLRYEALFPYAQGLEFMQQGLKLDGWNELNKLFPDPPVNTKEIFDPAAYFQHEAQPTLPMLRPPRLSKMRGLRFITENTMGELGYYSLLGQLLSEAEAKKVGPAWVADRYLIFATPQPNTFVLASRTEWRSPALAAEFFQDYQQVLAKKYPGLERDPRTKPDLFIGSTTRGWVVLMDRGNECRWIEGISKAQVGAMMKWLRSL
jgi:hypothetical protein